MAEQEQGKMDITEHQKAFGAFIRFWAYLFGAALLILIFLALVNA